MFEKALNFAKTFNLQYPPIIQAPMAGGITTPELVSSVSNFGGLGSFATGYLNPNQVLKGITSIQNLSDKPFSVNLFIPPYEINIDREKIKNYQIHLNTYRKLLGLPEKNPNELPEISKDYLEEVIDIVLSNEIKILSFTFGILSKKHIEKFKNKNIYLLGTATSVLEAQALEAAGIDTIVAQGSEAGGHRGSFLNDSMMSTDQLVETIARKVDIPIIAAGGIVNASHILAALQAGASAVQIGTAFLPLKESGASTCYKSAVLEAQAVKNKKQTTLTRAYSGKRVRGLWTDFIRHALPDSEIPDYPIPHYLTQEIRKEASLQSNKELMSFFCGERICDIDPNHKTVEQFLNSLTPTISYQSQTDNEHHSLTFVHRHD